MRVQLPETESTQNMPTLTKRMKVMAEKLPKTEAPISVEEAVKILKQFPPRKFDQSVELTMRLGIDAKQADQLVRGAIVLPHGIGKSKKVAVFAKGDKAEEAKAAGADVVGAEDLAAKIKEGWADFDACIASPDMMGLVGPLGKVLGPRGLMPSPRAGTVTMDVAKTVKEYKAGKVEFRNDDTGIVHGVVGKLSFDEQKLVENTKAFIDHIMHLKPHSVKGVYVKSITLSATMSPGLKVIG
jgi:large subunit ribosomal protein L1